VVFQIEDNGTNDNYRLYVNGVKEGEKLAGPKYSPDTNASFVIGGRVDYTKWHGGIDDVRYYDYILTPADITNLYMNPARRQDGRGVVEIG